MINLLVCLVLVLSLSDYSVLYAQDCGHLVNSMSSRGGNREVSVEEWEACIKNIFVQKMSNDSALIVRNFEQANLVFEGEIVKRQDLKEHIVYTIEPHVIFKGRIGRKKQVKVIANYSPITGGMQPLDEGSLGRRIVGVFFIEKHDSKNTYQFVNRDNAWIKYRFSISMFFDRENLLQETVRDKITTNKGARSKKTFFYRKKKKGMKIALKN